MSKKKIAIGIVAAMIVCICLYRPQKIVIKIGVFAGSNWDVPSGNSYKVIDQAIERFEKENPMIQVEYESGILKEDYSSWLSSKILNGDEPDVFMILNEDFNTLSSLGALKSLNDEMEEDEDFDTTQYYEGALQSGIYQNNQYALPFESNPHLMFVNKTLLQKEGIDIPKNEWSLDEFYKICQQITKDSNGDGVIDQYGCYNYSWLDSVYSHEATLFNEQGTECYFSQESVKNSLNFIKKLEDLNQGHVITATEFDKGQVAFSPMTFANYRTYKPYPWRVKKYSTFEWDCIKMPSLSLEENNSRISTLLMGISSRTSHSYQAWSFLKYLTYNEQTQLDLFQYSQGVSSLKKVTQSKEVLSQLNREDMGESQIDLSLLNDVMENAINPKQFKKYDSALSLADTRIQQIIRNEEDLDTSLMSLQKEINQYLNE